MEPRERYGEFVIHAEEGRTSAGAFYRAVQVGPSGYERHVSLFCSVPLLQEVRLSVRTGLQGSLHVRDPFVARTLRTGIVGKTAFLAHERTEGRSLESILAHARAEHYPLATDQALLIASRVASALEAASAKKQPHGFLVPEFVHVSHEGEVRVRGFGLPTRKLRDVGCIGRREALFLPPEALKAASPDVRSDIFSVGVQLFEMLTGSELVGAAVDAVSSQRTNPAGESVALSGAVQELLLNALAEDPARRYQSADELRKAIDTVLYSSQHGPTTFGLALYMHTLFRDAAENDAVLIIDESQSDYVPNRSSSPAIATDAAVDRPGPTPALEPATSAASATSTRRALPASVGVLALIAAVGTSVYALNRSGVLAGPGLRSVPVNPAVDAEATPTIPAALSPSAEVTPAPEPDTSIEAAPLPAGRPSVVPPTPRNPIPAARDSIVLAPSPNAGPTPRLVSTPLPPPDPTIAPAPVLQSSSPQPTPSLQIEMPPAGTPEPQRSIPTLLDLGAAGVSRPQLLSGPKLEYPRLAMARRIVGTVGVDALIDEQGSVLDAKVAVSADARYGLDQAALANVKRRRYSPATLNGAPGRVWMRIDVTFKL